jgi:hypothetical protein
MLTLNIIYLQCGIVTVRIHTALVSVYWGYQEWTINRNWQLHNYHYIYSFIYSYNMYVPSSIDKYWNIKSLRRWLYRGTISCAMCFPIALTLDNRTNHVNVKYHKPPEWKCHSEDKHSKIFLPVFRLCNMQMILNMYCMFVLLSSVRCGTVSFQISHP